MYDRITPPKPTLDRARYESDWAARPGPQPSARPAFRSITGSQIKDVL